MPGGVAKNLDGTKLKTKVLLNLATPVGEEIEDA
jgi:hypothetical protein